MAWPTHPTPTLWWRQDKTMTHDAVVARSGTILRKGKMCRCYHIFMYRKYFLESGCGIGSFYE